MLSNRVIYNKIKWCLINIPDDFVIEKHVRLQIGIIISCGKFIMSCKSQEPMKKQKNQSMKPGNEWQGREVCWGRDFLMTQPRRGRYHGIKLW